MTQFEKIPAEKLEQAKAMVEKEGIPIDQAIALVMAQEKQDEGGIAEANKFEQSTKADLAKTRSELGLEKPAQPDPSIVFEKDKIGSLESDAKLQKTLAQILKNLENPQKAEQIETALKTVAEKPVAEQDGFVKSIFQGGQFQQAPGMQIMQGVPVDPESVNKILGKVSEVLPHLEEIIKKIPPEVWIELLPLLLA